MPNKEDFLEFLIDQWNFMLETNQFANLADQCFKDICQVLYADEGSAILTEIWLDYKP